MFGNMKRLILGVALIGGVMSGNCAGSESDVISYHLFSDSPYTPVVVSQNTTLQSELDKCNDDFQSADCACLDDVAEILIPKLKNIFIGKNDKQAETNINSLEEKVFNKETKIPEAVNEIIKLRAGLPNASLHLSHMYEQIGLDRLALLWGDIAYKLGNKQAKTLIKRLLIKLDLRK